jgi:hypothetical protein
MCISRHSNHGNQNSEALIAGQRLVEQQISTKQYHTKFQLSNHVVAKNQNLSIQCTFSNNAERLLINKNEHSYVKGEVLPSSQKMVKLTKREATPDPKTIPSSFGLHALLNVFGTGSIIGTITKRIAAESGA